ncbi:NAD-dependent epimerase/dehydratase family protein [Streptomyces sp. NPDC026672]|uniref:NAD-dependent epimerase/dehydratase family protein n=1 Tax=unclassified Streptomyces TaxID=2593676 RepID=UPI0033F87433
MSAGRSRRIVVTGATGNVGTSVVRALAAADEVDSVLGLARRVPSWSPEGTEWAQADVARDERLAELFRGADAVVHLAWRIQPARDPITTWRTNALGSLSVFRAVADARVPTLAYASSVGAYSPGPAEPRVDESWPTHGWPTAAYCREKAYVERLLDSFERDRPEVRVIRMRPAFMFKREAASEQRRIFGGHWLPGRLVRPERTPFVPDIPGLRFQSLHTADAGRAFRMALASDARGAFNLAAEPPLDARVLGELFHARVVPVPAVAVRSLLSAAWGLGLAAVPPALFDALLRLPLMDCARAREEFGWEPHRTATEALQELLSGVRTGSGLDTPPLVGRTVGD